MIELILSQDFVSDILYKRIGTVLKKIEINLALNINIYFRLFTILKHQLKMVCLILIDYPIDDDFNLDAIYSSLQSTR